MRASRCRLVPLVALLLSLARPAWANPITVAAGHRVTVTFGTNPSNWDPTDPPDYLDFFLGVQTSDWLSATKSVDVALYDGDRLLGSRSGTGVGAVFYGTGMEGSTGFGNFIDFTSLLDGTIDGRIEVSPTAGAFRFDPANFDPSWTGARPLVLFDVWPDGGFWAAQGDHDWLRDVQVSVTKGNHAMDIATPVPEPGTLTLLTTGLGIGALRARKRRQRRQEDAPAR